MSEATVTPLTDAEAKTLTRAVVRIFAIKIATTVLVTFAATIASEYALRKIDQKHK